MSHTGAALPSFERAAHLRKNLEFLEAQLARADNWVMPVWRGLSLVAEQSLKLLPLTEARPLFDLGGELVWLGMLGDASCFALDVSSLADPAQHPALAGRGEFKELRFIGASLPADQAQLAAYARGILYWHGRQRHCGACGQPTSPRQGGHVRVCRNADCASEHFPRTDPAVIMLVYDGESCLLGRQRTWPRGMYSTLAGFVEPGETIEEAVAREIAEESGVRVTDVRYFRSQPWPYPSSLMLGFTARAQSSEIHLGDDELEDARWFTRAQLRESQANGFFVPGSFSLAGQLIQAFLAGEADRP